MNIDDRGWDRMTRFPEDAEFRDNPDVQWRVAA